VGALAHASDQPSQPGIELLSVHAAGALADVDDEIARTLDLNGYSIITTSATPSGIAIMIATGTTRVKVGNGYITGSGTNSPFGSYSGGGFVKGLALATNSDTGESLVAHDLTVSGFCRWSLIVHNGRPLMPETQRRTLVAAALGWMLDAFHDDLWGGTGDVFDWSVVPKRMARPLILSGGLTVDSVAGALTQAARNVSSQPFLVFDNQHSHFHVRLTKTDEGWRIKLASDSKIKVGLILTLQQLAS
jgi:hypothetical protein